MRTMNKIADTREPETITSKLLETGWLKNTMQSGDYWFLTCNQRSVGIERKTVLDLLGSISNRLSIQLYGLLEQYDISILLIEGSWKTVLNRIITDRGIEYYTWTVAWNYLRTWQDRGVTLELTSNEGHTVRRLNELYAYYQKEYHAGGLRKQILDDNRLLAIQCDGIGPIIGKILLDKFGSLKNIVNASVQDLLATDKIGIAKAKSIYNHFNKESKIGQ